MKGIMENHEVPPDGVFAFHFAMAMFFFTVAVLIGIGVLIGWAMWG